HRFYLAVVASSEHSKRKKIHKCTQTSTSTTKPIIRGAMLTIFATLAMPAPTDPRHSNAGFAKDTI
ncbi:8457_t:CDS:1, partial [Ambispora gerdemannii]